MTYHEELAETFKSLHGCMIDFLYTVPVRQVFQGNEIWDGSVWLFKLIGHPKAQFGYAWLHPNDAGNDLEITTVLQIPPVDSAQLAVQAADNAQRTNKARMIVTTDLFAYATAMRTSIRAANL